MKIGFAIITEDTFFDNIIKIQNAVAGEYPFKDLLGAKHNLPHTTLFQGNFSDEMDYEKVADKTAKKFCSLISEKTVAFDRVIYQPEGWYFYMMEKTEPLQELHEYVLKKIEPYLVLDPKRMERNLDALSEEEINGIEKYGYRYSGSAFFPHITIGRTAGGEDLSLLNKLQQLLPPSETSIHRITVYKMGPDGTHADTLYEVSL